MVILVLAEACAPRWSVTVQVHVYIPTGQAENVGLLIKLVSRFAAPEPVQK